MSEIGVTYPEDVRRRLGLEIDEAPDEVVWDYIHDAEKDLRRDISHFMFDDVLSGDINGSNTTFTLSQKYIADKNFDGTVTVTDVEVYGWADSDDPGTRTSLAVGTIYPNYGQVVMSTAPASTFEQLTATYYYYFVPVDKELIPSACMDLAAFYFAEREILLMPKQWMHGAYRFLKSGEYEKLKKSYREKVDRILGYASMVDEHDDVELMRDDV